MSIYQVFVISRAGSLIYDWEAKSEMAEVEWSSDYPLEVVLEEIDQKPVVVFGEKEGVKLRYYVTGINGFQVSGTRFFIDDKEQNVLLYLKDKDNYPVNLKFSPPTISTNEKIILSSMFHSLFTIAVQLSPVAKSSGIEVLETSQFKLSCLQSRTGVKFVVVTSSSSNIPVDSLLNKLYELYADFALKNPFYAIDMPIRCSKFEDGLKSLLEKIEKNSGAMTIDNITFLNKIPDQCGYIIFSKDEGIVKSEGDLANRDLTALIVEKMLNLSRMDVLPNTKFNQISIVFKEHFYTISQSGKYIFMVKRRLSV